MSAEKQRQAASLLICALALLVLGGGTASADDKMLEELKARLERMEKHDEEQRQRLEKLEKQNEELREKLAGEAAVGKLSASPYKPETAEKEKVNQMIDSYLKEKEVQKRAEAQANKAQQEEEGYKIGSNLGLTARWNANQGLIFETENRDFVSHIGWFFQFDTVAFTQSKNLLPSSQLGELQDGAFFRRLRPLWDGHAWDFVEWNIILALEQVQGTVNSAGTAANSNINLDEVWAGMFGLPIIGRIRAGHLKVCQGLEGNQWSSSRAMTFMENAAYTEAFYNVFATGVQILNSGLNDGCNGDRVTWQAMVYRDDNPRTNDGEDFGDGDYGATARMSALLIDTCEDREFLHVGLSGTWRKAQRTGNDQTGNPVINFQARPELRDGIGGFDGFNFPGNTSRMVATGNIQADSAGVVGSELWYNLGPLSVMAEWAWASMNDAVVPVTVGKTTKNVSGDRTFNGGYVTLSYFLTGESRAYDHTFGREFTFYINRPNTNFWFVRDDEGGVSVGPGAWEVAVRYSYLNLNDGPVQGGVMGGMDFALNWYINNNLKVQFDYIHNNRYDKGGAGGATGSGGNVPGVVDGFGSRMQIQF